MSDNSNEEKMKYNKIFNNFLCIVVLVLPTMYFGCKGKAAEMGIALLMGALVSAFLNLDKFSSFKGAGFEAQLREAKETADKAIVTMEKLERIIRPLLFNSLNTIIDGGRLNAGGSVENKDIIRDGCKEILSIFNMPDEKLKDLICTYDRYIVWDFYTDIVNYFTYSDHYKQNEDAKKIYEELNKNRVNYKLDNYPKIDEIKQSIENNNIAYESITDELNQLIDNYQCRLEYYNATYK